MTLRNIHMSPSGTFFLPIWTLLEANNNSIHCVYLPRNLAFNIIMGICRLCGDEKSVEGSITLQSQVKMGVTFKELVEYYCRIDIDPELTLPQMVCTEFPSCGNWKIYFCLFQVCLCCKTSILKFTEFSYKAGQAQDTFVKVKVEVEDTEDFPVPHLPGSEPSPKRMKVDDARISEVKTMNESQDNLLVEISEQEALGGGKRVRTKSIYGREAIDTALAKDNVS